MGAIASLLSEGRDSLLFNGGEVNDLLNQLQLLIKNKELRNSFGNNGYRKVIENYTWPVIVERYRNAYKLGIENFERQYKQEKLRPVVS
jgi:glycosyltransferase involved in cell wall biosynthesis